MSFHRPSEEHQVEMFQAIESRLAQFGLNRYEISNFAKPGFESKHNLLYWQDEEYLGFGLSAHSYSKSLSQWGDRFWNPSTMEKYRDLVLKSTPYTAAKLHEEKMSETLDQTDALFDFSHTALRLETGLDEDRLHQKFSPASTEKLRAELHILLRDGLVHQPRSNLWVLTEKGRHLSNFVFSCLHSASPDAPLTSSHEFP